MLQSHRSLVVVVVVCKAPEGASFIDCASENFENHWFEMLSGRTQKDPLGKDKMSALSQ